MDEGRKAVSGARIDGHLAGVILDPIIQRQHTAMRSNYVRSKALLQVLEAHGAVVMRQFDRDRRCILDGAVERDGWSARRCVPSGHEFRELEVLCGEEPCVPVAEEV